MLEVLVSALLSVSWWDMVARGLVGLAEGTTLIHRFPMLDSYVLDH